LGGEGENKDIQKLGADFQAYGVFEGSKPLRNVQNAPIEHFLGQKPTMEHAKGTKTL